MCPPEEGPPTSIIKTGGNADGVPSGHHPEEKGSQAAGRGSSPPSRLCGLWCGGKRTRLPRPDSIKHLSQILTLRILISSLPSSLLTTGLQSAQLHVERALTRQHQEPNVPESFASNRNGSAPGFGIRCLYLNPDTITYIHTNWEFPSTFSSQLKKTIRIHHIMIGGVK